MSRLARYLGQALTLVLFGLAVGVFSDTPRYRHLGEDRAVVKLSLVLSTERAGQCRRRTAEELARLAPNMRKPLDCPRGRLPLLVELEIDGAPVYRASAQPTGLAGDGPARVYRSFELPAGPHRLAARLRTSARADGFDYTAARELTLAPRQNLVIDFKQEAGGLVFR